jgi:hypothetical protein
VADAVCRMKRKYIVHANQLNRTHRVACEKDSLSVQFGMHCMKSSCVLFMYNLYKGCSEGAIMIASNSLVSSVL